MLQDDRLGKLEAAIAEWCKWMNIWSSEVYNPCNLPRPITRTKLQMAGRNLFEITGVDPHVDGLYSRISPPHDMSGKPIKGQEL